MKNNLKSPPIIQLLIQSINSHKSYYNSNYRKEILHLNPCVCVYMSLLLFPMKTFYYNSMIVIKWEKKKFYTCWLVFIKHITPFTKQALQHITFVHRATNSDREEEQKTNNLNTKLINFKRSFTLESLLFSMLQYLYRIRIYKHKILLLLLYCSPKCYWFVYVCMCVCMCLCM